MQLEELGRHTLDYVASKKEGYAKYFSGSIADEIENHQDELEQIIRKTKKVAPYLLEPLDIANDPDDFPLVLEPTDEPAVVIEPNEDGLIPVAAYWQSGWQNALSYVIVRQSVFLKLLSVLQILKPIDEKLCLVLMDGWRSNEHQQAIFDAFYPNGYKHGEPIYVSEPHDDEKLVPPHPSGGTVDVFLGINGQAINLGTPFDYFEVESNTSYFETDGSNNLVRDLRRILTNAMKKQDFVVIDSEWWHFEYGTRRWAKIKDKEPIYGNLKFDSSLYEGIARVKTIAGSRREQIERGPNA